MKRTELKFPSLNHATAFLNAAQPRIYTFNKTSLTLSAWLPSAHLRIAEEQYGASMIITKEDIPLPQQAFQLTENLQ